MADVHVSTDSLLLTITAGGALAKNDIIQVLKEHYPRAGRLILWDLTGADVSGLTTTDLADVACAARSVARSTGHGRTAYLVADTKTYMTLCLYLNAAVASHVPAEYAVFRQADEARKWLLQP